MTTATNTTTEDRRAVLRREIEERTRLLEALDAAPAERRRLATAVAEAPDGASAVSLLDALWAAVRAELDAEQGAGLPAPAPTLEKGRPPFVATTAPPDAGFPPQNDNNGADERPGPAPKPQRRQSRKKQPPQQDVAMNDLAASQRWDALLEALRAEGVYRQDLAETVRFADLAAAAFMARTQQEFDDAATDVRLYFASAGPPPATYCVTLACDREGWCSFPARDDEAAAARAFGMAWAPGAACFSFPFADLACRLQALARAGLTVSVLPPPGPGNANQELIRRAVEASGVAQSVVVLPAPRLEEEEEGNAGKPAAGGGGGLFGETALPAPTAHGEKA